MRLVWGTSADPLGQCIGAFVAERIPQVLSADLFGAYTAFGVVSTDDRLLGGVLFHNYRPDVGNIEVSFASDGPRWLTRPVIAQIMSYPFVQLKCRRVTAATPRKAASARRFLETFGFRREGLMREGFGDDDLVLSGLLASEWFSSRWARPSRKGDMSGQERSNTAAGA